MITTVTLSRGAVRMSRKKVIVKRLAAIHDLGAMTVLCTDKTGTLTSAEIDWPDRWRRTAKPTTGLPRLRRSAPASAATRARSTTR